MRARRAVYVVMEHAEGGDLFKMVNARCAARHAAPPPAAGACSVVSSDEARAVAFRALSALAFLHGRGLWHRDVKLDNLLTTARVGAGDARPFARHTGDPRSVKLADLGHAKATRAASESPTGGRGTAAYWAPEQSRGEGAPPRGSDTDKTDVWALGVTLWALMLQSYAFGTVPDSRAPNYHAELTALKQRIIGGAPQLTPQQATQLQRDYPPQATRLLERMLAYDPAARPTVAEALAHEWLAGAAEAEA